MKQKTPRPLVKKYSSRWWKSQLNNAEKRYEKFVKAAEESIRVFNAIPQIETLKDAPRRLNVWWYCTNTLLPAYYSSTPKAEVNLRKRAGGIPYELGSVILERNTQYSMDCHFDFDKVGHNAAIQFLLTGQAVLWARYKPKFEKVLQEVAVIRDPSGAFLTGDGKPYEGDVSEFTETTGGILISSVEVEQKVSEKAILDVVQYSHYRCSDARNESEIEWQAKRAFLDREEAETLFGSEKAERLNYDSVPETNKKDYAKDKTDIEGKAEVWECWCEATNKVYWIQTSLEDAIIEESEPAIRFEKFYPCIVIRQTQDPDSVIPVSDYTHCKDQILEVERLTTRIHALTQAIRPNFAYDATMGDLIEQLFQDDLKGIGVTNWTSAQGRGGLAAGINFLPVDQFVNVLNTLQQSRQTALQQLYETLKVSDLLRGTSEQYKSATANRLENQWSSLGLIVRQNMFNKFMSDAISNLGTIIAEQFDEQRILEIADADALIAPTIFIPEPPPPPPMPEGQEGMPPGESPMPPMAPPQPDPAMLLEQTKQQIVEILRDNNKRNYRIEIASDSMVAIDQAQQQQEGQALIGAAGQFFDQMRGLIDQYPPLIEFSIGLFQNMIKRFKGGKELDGIFTKALQQIGEISKAKEEAAKQPPPPDPKTLEIQGRMQIAQIESQARMQVTQMDMQDKAVKNQLAAQEQQLKMQRDQLEAQLRVQDQQFKEFLEQQKLAISQQEVQIKAQSVQVDMLKVQSSAQSEADKALIKQESSQMQHILEIQKLELEQMRIRLSESEKLMEERRLASEQSLERIRMSMETIQTKGTEQPKQEQKPIVIQNIIPKASRRKGVIGTDDLGNTTLSIEDDEDENED